MTASKSSRARAQRARANAASNGGAAGRANGNGTAAKSGTAVKAGTPVKAGASVKGGAPVKDGTVVKGGTVIKAGSTPRTVAARGGGGRGSRGPALEREAYAEAPATATIPLWFQLVTWVLALAGLGVSIYLTIAHFTESALLGCSESGLVNCTKVTTSPQSYVFGIPVAVLGLAFYVAAVALMSPWAWRSPRREIHLIRLASLVVGIGFVLYLLYAELFIIGSICLYCTSVHAITFVLFGLTVFAAAAWGLPKSQRS
jgi:uncharacterized membrane protein